MRYIADISNGADWVSWPPSDGVTVTARDEDGRDLIVSNGHLYNCLGFSKTVAVKHHRCHIGLYEFIDEAWTVCSRPVIQNDGDFCFLDDDGVERHPGAKVLDINTGHYGFYVYGKLGSVVEVARGQNIRYMSLFELLIQLCVSTGVNIMSYDLVQLGSTDVPYSTKISFKHGVDADRFFMKMHLEAGKYGEAKWF